MSEPRAARDLELSEEENRRLEDYLAGRHLHETSEDSGTDRQGTVVVVVSQSSDDIIDDVKRIVGPDIDTFTVPWVRGIFGINDPDCDLPEHSDLGTVEVAIMTDAVFKELEWEFEMKNIYVRLNDGEDERAAFIPVARAVRGATSDDWEGDTDKEEDIVEDEDMDINIEREGKAKRFALHISFRSKRTQSAR